MYLIEILHQTTTVRDFLLAGFLLYLIEILHQTTTTSAFLARASRLYLIEILHQTTTRHVCQFSECSCILSKFYIKPQPKTRSVPAVKVVSYRNSTSNHNQRVPQKSKKHVVSYRNSTSNHNTPEAPNRRISVVSYRNSTSNHNKAFGRRSGRFVVSYRNSTSNHNHNLRHSKSVLLYLIEILHQTTTDGDRRGFIRCCILSKFYIKPQRTSATSD